MREEVALEGLEGGVFDIGGCEGGDVGFEGGRGGCDRGREGGDVGGEGGGGPLFGEDLGEDAEGVGELEGGWLVRFMYVMFCGR